MVFFLNFSQLLDQITQPLHPKVVGDKKDDELISNTISLSDFFPILAVPRMEAFNVYSIIDHSDLVLLR